MNPSTPADFHEPFTDIASVSSNTHIVQNSSSSSCNFNNSLINNYQSDERLNSSKRCGRWSSQSRPHDLELIAESLPIARKRQVRILPSFSSCCYCVVSS